MEQIVWHTKSVLNIGLEFLLIFGIALRTWLLVTFQVCEHFRNGQRCFDAEASAIENCVFGKKVLAPKLTDLEIQ